MMPPLYERIRRNFVYIVLVLVVSFASVSFVLVWQETKINDNGDRNAEHHVPTILLTSDIAKLLARLEASLQADNANRDEHQPGTIDHAHLSAEQGARSLYIVRKDLDSIVELQTSFGGRRYQRTVEKIAVELSALSSAIEVGALAPGAADRHEVLHDQLLGLRALIVSIEQLERLHVIAYDEVKRDLAAQIWRRNVVVFPAAVVILLCALVGLGYLTSQTRGALVRLEQADRALQSLNSELEQRIEERTSELRTAQEGLIRKERLAALGQLTGTVSHELRNPLGAIRSASDAIRRFADDENPQMNRALALLERSQVRCDRIIEDLLNYTRVRELNRDATQVDDWLEELLGEHGVTDAVSLRKELAADIEVALDRDRLERALRNVIDNACHAMEGHGDESAEAKNHQLTVASRATDQRLEISIGDTGPGIAPEEQAKIFEPLYSTKSFGVGLGLPMVKQIMEQHGGGIEIRSQSGRGTEVVLWLPRAVPEQGAAA